MYLETYANCFVSLSLGFLICKMRMIYLEYLCNSQLKSSIKNLRDIMYYFIPTIECTFLVGYGYWVNIFLFNGFEFVHNFLYSAFVIMKII